MNHLSALPVALPLAVAALLMALSDRLPRRIRDSIAIGTAAATLLLSTLLLAQTENGLLVTWFGGWEPRQGVAIGISFAIDSLGAGLAVLAAGLTVASLTFCWRYFDEVGPLFPTLMLVFLGAMQGFCLTGDLFNLFVFFELMSVAAYALTAHKIEEEQALMGAFNFAITNSVGAFLVLLGIGLLYGRTGALNLAQIGRTLAEGPLDGLVIVSLVLITTGFGIKAALVPFQFWLADAHAVAPTPVCVLFSGVMVELGLYAVARVYWTVFAGVVADQFPGVRLVWMALGVLTALVGAFMCFAECHIKRLLAFSTIGHTGVLLIGIALLTPAALAGTSIYLISHGLIKGGLFLGAGILLNRFASVDENELRGRGKILPGVGVAFLLGGFALSGLPPFGTYLGKAVIDRAAHEQHFPWLPPLLLLAEALTGAAVLRVTGQVFLGWGPPQNREAGTPRHEQKETDETYNRAPLVMLLPALGLLLLALLPGLWPTLSRHVHQAAIRFQDRSGYAAAVLDGQPMAPLSLPPEPPRQEGALYGFGGSTLALLIALAALFPRWLPGAVRRIIRGVAGVFLSPLRGLHSGHGGDYVAWVAVGVAAVGISLAILLGG